MRILEISSRKHFSEENVHISRKKNLCLVISHVARGGAELSIGFDDLVHGLQKVFLCGNFSTSSDCEHPCLCTHTANLSTWEKKNTDSNVNYSLQQQQCWKPQRVSLSQCKYSLFKWCAISDICIFVSKNSPVLLGQRRARSSKRISLSTLIERAWILKMWVRP